MTFSVSYVVVIVRSRLAAIGPEYEEAARDLGASPRQALQHVLLPLLMPAILASMLIVFALSIDDFVVTQYMSSSGVDDDDPDAALLQRPRRRDDAGAERGGDDHGRHHADRGRRRLPRSALVRPPHRVRLARRGDADLTAVETDEAIRRRAVA